MLLQLESSKVIVTTGTIAETSCRKTANTSGFSGKVFSMLVPWKQLRLMGYNNEPFLWNRTYVCIRAVPHMYVYA